MIYRIIATIKPTNNNKQIMLNRGLFSNDHWAIFDIYESMYQNKSYEINARDYDYILEELIELGIKF